MVTFIRSDLDFILAQIQIAEAHALYDLTDGAQGRPLFGPNGSVPEYNVAFGLRTVDGTFNHLLPTQEEWGSSDLPFPHLLDPVYRPADGTPLDLDGPGGMPPISTAPNYNPSGDPNSWVVDSSPRTISNLIVDQTLANPAAIMTALQRNGVDGTTQLEIAALIKAAYDPLADLFQAIATAEREYAAAAARADASPLNTELQDAADAAFAVLTTAQNALAAADDGLMALLGQHGIELEGANVKLPNIAPDEGLSASFNSWFTLFGQFFDHGLDLVNKGGSGTVLVPLQPDDPLYVPGSPTNFMVLTRATTSPGPDGDWGTSDDVEPMNTTTPFVDQNQTYTSHPSHQVFLREYVTTATGPVATGKLIEGGNGGMATWGEVKAQALTILGINLTDDDVGSVPLVRTDAYGNFIPSASGYPQLIVGLGADGIPNTADDLVRVYDPDGTLVDTALIDYSSTPISTSGALRTSHAFLADIAHDAVPDGLADGDTEVGLNNPGADPGDYDNELLDAHFIAGDGRANENIGLTAVHHVFHAEHNRLVDHTKEVVLADAAEMLAGGATQAEAVAFLNEWLAVNVAAVPVGQAAIDALVWDGARLFQAAKFGTEMQYQHLVFEEFARKVQPGINAFLVPDGFDTTMNPAIFAEFAHVVYRFGHSMLTETIDRFDENFVSNDISLIQGFLNPLAFNGVGGAIADEIAAGDIIRGMTRQVGNDIDEFVTSALRNNLLGLPLDLATINLTRGRDAGVPSLNAARAQFYEMTAQNEILRPYVSWTDFASHLKHEASIINFVAAYGTHDLITSQTTFEGKRDAALAIITGVETGGIVAPADRLDFLNATGAYAGGDLGGLNNVDLWIGGLAEAISPFGGMLGSTFAYVFELQLELLQSGDRFYYLQRLDGLHLFGEMENNSFASMIMRNTDATHLPSDVFSTPGLILEVDQSRQFNDLDGDGDLESDDPVGTGIITQLVIRDNPLTVGPDNNYLRYTGTDHVVIGGTAGNDRLISSIGDDTLYGDEGNDFLDGGHGNDIINGGDGDDIVVDPGGDDNVKGGAGNDVIHAGPGLDLILAGSGQDFVFLGTDEGSEVFGGTGNDFVYGNKNAERILGNEGDDWIETGTFDGAPGDNFDEIFARDGIDGHDVFLGDGGFDEFIAEGGNDIMVGSPGRGKMVGMSGFDWATYKDMLVPVVADIGIPIIFDENPIIPENAALDEYESIEGLSGSRFDDTLTGTDETAETLLPLPLGGTGGGYRGSYLTQDGIDLIDGLAEVLGLDDPNVLLEIAPPILDGNPLDEFDLNAIVFGHGDIILGGDGDDVINGKGGNDVIDGDAWLDVQIGVFAPDDVNHTGTPLALHNSMTTLAAAMFAGDINPGQLSIVRTIRYDENPADAGQNVLGGFGDRAVFSGNFADYTISTTDDGALIIANDVEDGLDGIDRLRNIEELAFADGVIELAPHVGTAEGETMNGSDAVDDLLFGMGGNDILNGMDGNDNLVGGPGNDTLNGGDDNDTYHFGLTDGNDTINEAANDGAADRIRVQGLALPLIALEAFDDNVATNDGNLVILFNGQSITVANHFDGTNAQTGVELINFGGGSFEGYQFGFGDYTISKLDPADRETGGVDLGGSDTDNFIVGEQVTDDEIIGSDQNDLIFGGSGNDTLGGAAGDDLLVGGEGADELNGDAGNDTLVGGAGADTLNGGADDDTLVGGAGADTLNGGDGNDTLDGGADDDSLSGGGGNDTYRFGVADGNDTINEAAAGGTADRILVKAGAPVLTGLSALDSDPAAGSGDLVISFNGQTVTVAGHFVSGNAETGVELINFDGRSFEGYALGTGNYAISKGVTNLAASSADNLVAGHDGVADVITGGSGKDLLFGGTGDDVLGGGGGSDLLVGGVGVDALNGGAGADTLLGGEGDDTLDGGIGADSMVGGDGNDTYLADNADDVVIELADGGTDHVISTFSHVLGTNVENLTLTGSAGLSGTGNALANVIIGNSGANVINAGGGNDTVSAGGGADAVLGGDGADTIDGGDGNDLIGGGGGDDTLGGGSGDDTFVWNAAGAEGRDVVDGGTENGIGDTFIVHGDASAENYAIYTRAAWDALVGNDLASLQSGTEIVITRNGTGFASVVAELREIEKIHINGFDATGPAGGGDTFGIFGDFSATSLLPNTIIIEGGNGNDMLDLSTMSGANVVFRPGGGINTIVDAKLTSVSAPENTSGAVYAPDVSTFARGAGAPVYSLSGADAGRFAVDANTGAVRFLSAPDFEKPGDADGNNVYDLVMHASDGSLVTTKALSIAVTDVLGRDIKGTKDNDTINGQKGPGIPPQVATEEADIISGKKGNDKLFGLGGNDVLKGNGGKDKLDGGTGDDLLIGGGGKDKFIFASGYGNDVVRGYKAGTDVFDLKGTDVDNFAELRSMMSKAGKSVVIDFGDGDTLTIAKTKIKTLVQNQADFDFA